MSDKGTTPLQRRFSRADVNFEARYEHRGATTSVSAEIRNLGGGGLRLASPEDLPREEILTIHFDLPSLAHEVTLRGKVVMSFYDASQSVYLHGIAFTQMVHDDQAAIVEYIESIEHQASDQGA